MKNATKNVIWVAGMFLLVCMLLVTHTSSGRCFMNTSLSEIAPLPRLHVEFNVSSAPGQDRFPKHVPMIWTRETANVSFEPVVWWEGIYKQENLNDTKTIQMFSDMEEHGYISSSPPKHEMFYSTCAVVGNSDNLLGKKHGQLIDKHDAIFRFNNAVTHGYEEDVGGRTTHKMNYMESYGNFDKTCPSPSCIWLYMPFKMADMRWLMFQTTGETLFNRTVLEPFQARKVHHSLKDTWVIHPHFMYHVWRDWIRFGRHFSRKIPSLGMIGLIFALENCEEVSVFGYGENDEGEWAHYFKDIVVKASDTNHDNIAENDLLLQLHHNHVIKYFSPSTEAWWI